jgi:hypothetical protein
MEQPAPYAIGVTVTTSDTIPIAPPSSYPSNALPDAIFVGGAGIVVVVWPDGSTSAFTCVAGEILPVRALRVNSTTTTATLMVALYR